MKLLIVLEAILIFSPSIAIGRTYYTEVASAPDPYGILDVSNICNETVSLNFSSSLTLNRDSIVSSFVRCITIRMRGIAFTEEAFDGVPNLKYLDLQGNGIRPNNLFAFGNLSSVKVLSLGNQDARYADNAIIRGVYPELEYLDLQNNLIEYIESEKLDPFPNLKHLDLSHNRIQGFSSNIFFNTLISINLSSNRISSLDLSSITSNNLLSLHLDVNELTEIGNTYNALRLKGFDKLVYLSVANNRISTVLSSEFQNMIDLRYLNLSDNRISSEEFGLPENLHALNVLALDGNLFQDVPTLLPLNITTLSLNCNNISYLSSNSFYKLSNLSSLHLSGNAIMDVSVDAFESQALLEVLYLDGNLLSHLPENWYRSMKNLRYLNLSGNRFASLDSVIYTSDMPLMELYFEHNPLKFLNVSALQLMPKTMKVYLNIGSESNNVSCTDSTQMQWY